MKTVPFLWRATATVRSERVLQEEGWQPTRSSSVLTASHPLYGSAQGNRKCDVSGSDSKTQVLTESAGTRLLR